MADTPATEPSAGSTVPAASSTSPDAPAPEVPSDVKPLDCYVWGSWDWDQPWDRESKVTLQYPTPFTALNDMKLSIKQISCGAKHTMIVTTDGKVFGFGNNAKGQLGLDVARTFKPMQVAADKGFFVEASCGTFHTLLLTREGKVFSFGHNLFGQLGHTKKVTQTVGVPTRVAGEIEFLKVVQIAAGGETSYALSDEGNVYAWGSVQYGALGTGTNGQRLEKAGKLLFDDEEKPVRVSWFNDNKIQVKKIAAGSKHLLVLTTDKKLYTCGHGAYGRLGQGSDAHDKLSPVPITWYTRKEIEITDILCGSEHSLCLAKVGSHLFVYFWGRPGNDQDGVMTPISVDALCAQGVNSLSGGKGFTLASTESGEAAVWGENSLCSCLGLLGTHKNKRMEPKVLDLLAEKHVQSVHAGFWHMMVLVDPAKSKGPVMLKVPMEGRETKTGGFVHAAKTPWEEVVLDFEAKCKGTSEGSAVKRPPEAPAAAPAAKKPKAAAKPAPKLPKGPLKPGTKLQVWMEDVYMEATVKSKCRAKDTYVLSYTKEGWKDEEIKLTPQDHTMDESNPERWNLL